MDLVHHLSSSSLQYPAHGVWAPALSLRALVAVGWPSLVFVHLMELPCSCFSLRIWPPYWSKLTNKAKSTSGRSVCIIQKLMYDLLYKAQEIYAVLPVGTDPEQWQQMSLSSSSYSRANHTWCLVFLSWSDVPLQDVACHWPHPLRPWRQSRNILLWCNSTVRSQGCRGPNFLYLLHAGCKEPLCSGSPAGAAAAARDIPLIPTHPFTERELGVTITNCTKLRCERPAS